MTRRAFLVAAPLALLAPAAASADDKRPPPKKPEPKPAPSPGKPRKGDGVAESHPEKR